MRYHELITESEESSFILNPACKPEDYQITDSFRDIKNWKSKSYYTAYYTPEAGGEIKKGSWINVGYVMISKIDNTIVPISRSDEHHHGYDMMHDRYGKKINVGQYFPIFVPGNNYVYGPKDIEVYKIILPKFLAYGGNPNSMLIGSNDMRGVKLSVGDFVDGHPFVKNDGKGIGRIGMRIYEMFVALSKNLADARNNSENPRFLNVAKKASEKLIKNLEAMMDTGLGIPWQNYEVWLKAIREADSEQALSEIIFGFHGVKNTIHNQLREVVDKADHWNRDNVEATWGNLEMAVDMLGKF